MRRNDFLDDRDAPKATSIVPSPNVVVVNHAGQILLVRRTDNANWSLPGGAMELGESLAESAVREVEEETGVLCEITGMVGIYTNPDHVVEYTSDGEVRQEFSVVLIAYPRGGRPETSDESSRVEWINPGHLDAYQMHPSMQMRIRHYLEGREKPYIG